MTEATAETEISTLGGGDQAKRLGHIKREKVNLGRLQSSNEWTKAHAERLKELEEEQNKILELPLTKEEERALGRQSHARLEDADIDPLERALIGLANEKTSFQKRAKAHE